MPKILLTGGGTAGHISPALSVAAFLKETLPNVEFLYVGNSTRMEAKLVPEAGIRFLGIKTTGFARKLTSKGVLQNIKALVQQVQGKSICKKWIREFAPDMVFSTGGYISVPVMRAALSLHIPVIIHESNSFPGLATKAFEKKVTCVLVGSEDTKTRLVGANVVLTGNPVNPKIFSTSRTEARTSLGLSENDICILSFGGSLGAETINRVMAYNMANLKTDRPVRFIHATGSYYTDEFPRFLAMEGGDIYDSRLDIREYIDDMPRLLAAADVIVSRAGAITIGEISASSKASILIPSPNVTENHQYHNAMTLGAHGGAFVITEETLEYATVLSSLQELVENQGLRERMGKIAHGACLQDANKNIEREIRAVLK